MELVKVNNVNGDKFYCSFQDVSQLIRDTFNNVDENLSISDIDSINITDSYGNITVEYSKNNGLIKTAKYYQNSTEYSTFNSFIEKLENLNSFGGGNVKLTITYSQIYWYINNTSAIQFASKREHIYKPTIEDFNFMSGICEKYGTNLLSLKAIVARDNWDHTEVIFVTNSNKELKFREDENSEMNRLVYKFKDNFTTKSEPIFRIRCATSY